MTTMTNDDDGGDATTGDEVDDDGNGATGDDGDDDDDGGDDNDVGDGATGDGSWICCRRVLQNSQTDHVSTIVAHTMTAKLISEEGCSTLCLRVRHKFYVNDFRTKPKICILAYQCFCVFVFLGMLQYGTYARAKCLVWSWISWLLSR